MEILLKPIVTEKLQILGEKYHRYGLLVDKRANKIQIKLTVEKLYNVTVEAVNTMNYRGKTKYRYTRSGVMKGKKSSYKKAIVTLKKGDTIDFFANV